MKRVQLLVVALAELRSAMTIDECARIDLNILVNNVAGHPCRFGQDDLLGFDLAINRPGKLDGIAKYATLHNSTASDFYRQCSNVPFDISINLYVLGTFELPCDL